MLTRWHYVAITAPLLLLLLEWRSPRHLLVGLLFAAVLLASAQAIVDTEIRAIRMRSMTPISMLPHTDPIRRRFGLLHGVSMLLLLGEAVTAGLVVARDGRGKRASEPANQPTSRSADQPVS